MTDVAVLMVTRVLTAGVLRMSDPKLPTKHVLPMQMTGTSKMSLARVSATSRTRLAKTLGSG